MTACLALNKLFQTFTRLRSKVLLPLHLVGAFMSVFRLVPRLSCIAALILSFNVETSSAQSLKRSSGPSELPPRSFQGKQFVDSNGCAFIRAGYSGRVSWIPRVSRSRKVLCGFRPTFEARAAAATPVEQPVRRVVQPKVRTVKQTKVQPRTTSNSGQILRSTAAPQINSNSRIAPKVKPVDRAIAPCVGASSLSSKYINNGEGVRCGPQSGDTRTVIRREVLKQSNLENQRRGPKGTNRRIARAKSIKAPKGYRAVHRDGRLNPLRGVGTTSGKTQMAAIWSNTVPRYLIDPATGKRLR